jgi:PAS domain S-box-containing protein
MIHFIEPGHHSSSHLPSFYSFDLVFISLFIACLASYIALKVSERARSSTNTESKTIWLFIGAISLGSGIFSMHFIGMLSFQLPIPVQYDLSKTLLSILPAIIGAAGAIITLTMTKVNFLTLNIGGLFMGLGIGCMHYMGMLAMQMNAHMAFDKKLFFLSLVLAHLLSTLSLTIKFLATKKFQKRKMGRHLIASLVMGSSIAGMHYTGMAAASYFTIDQALYRPIIPNSSSLIIIIIFVTLILFASAIVSLIIDKHIREIVLRREEAEEHKRNLDMAALVSETDTTGKITYVNQAFANVSKYSPEELIGHSHSLINSGLHSKEFWREAWKIIKSGEIWRGEVANRAKDGNIYWVQSTIIPIKDKDNKIIKYSSIRIDITDKKNAEKLMQSQSKLASIGEIVAGVGHEMNNPLAIVVGNIDGLQRLLNKDTIDRQEINKKLNHAKIASNRIRKIIDGLRVYSRSDSKEKSAISIKESIEETVALV